MRSIVKAKQPNNHILDFIYKYATLANGFPVPIQRRFIMASLQTALRSAGLSSAPDGPEEPEIQVRQPVAGLKRELVWQDHHRFGGSFPQRARRWQVVYLCRPAADYKTGNAPAGGRAAARV